MTKIQKEYLDYDKTTDVSTATPTPVGSNWRNVYTLTALAVDAIFSAPSGIPEDGNMILIRYSDNGIARAFAFNPIYRSVGVILPISTVISKTGYLICIYNSAAIKWDIVVAQVQA